MNKNLKKLIIAALLSALSFVISSVIVFPNMAPFQHFFNLIGAVILGPEYNFLSALITGTIRMASGRPILAIVGAVIGAYLSGYLYKKTKKISYAFIGEVIGTGIISAVLSYYIMKYGFNLPLESPIYYIPFFMPSSAIGAFFGSVLIKILKDRKILDKFDLNK